MEQRFTRVLALQKRIEIERDALKLIQDAVTAVKCLRDLYKGLTVVGRVASLTSSPF